VRIINETLVLLIVASAFMLDVQGASLASVTLPDTVEVGGQKLVLNGIGMRKKYFVEVYVGALYLPAKSSDADSIVKADAPRQMTMHFVRDVSKAQLIDAFNESFSNNAPDASKTMQSEIKQLTNALDNVKSGDEMAFTYQPGTGTKFSLNGKVKLTIPNPAFRVALFSGWLGPKPPTAELKKKLLGQ
jgi:hypothetical protein